MKNNLMDRNWWTAATIRAIKTMAQTAIATIGTATLLTEVRLDIVASATILSGALSILTSLAGLPEVNKDE